MWGQVGELGMKVVLDRIWEVIEKPMIKKQIYIWLHSYLQFSRIFLCVNLYVFYNFELIFLWYHNFTFHTENSATLVNIINVYLWIRQYVCEHVHAIEA